MTARAAPVLRGAMMHSAARRLRGSVAGRAAPGLSGGNPGVRRADPGLETIGSRRPRQWLRSRIHLRALHARKALRGAVSLLGNAPRNPTIPTRPRSTVQVPLAPIGAFRVRPSAALHPASSPRSRYLPVVIVGTGSSAAVWIVSMTSRAVLRYVVRPYLVRYLQSAESGAKLGLRAHGSRALIRLMLPSLAT